MIDQTEQLLRAGMERFTAETDVPPGLAARAARHRQRSTGARTVAMIGAGSVAAVTAVVVAVIAATPGPAPGVRTTAYVVSRVQAALAQASNRNAIQYVRETTSARIYLPYEDLSGRVVASWTYRGQTRTAAYTSGGQIIGDIGIVTTGHQETSTVVNYEHKTWWRRSQTVNSWPSVAPTPESSCEEATVIEGGGQGISNLAGDIRAALGCGQYVVAGTRHVDGVRALELRPVKPGTVTAVFWVDPATYLPVRDLVTIGSRATIQDDFRWLRPTQANLGALGVPIPPGFTQVPPKD